MSPFSGSEFFMVQDRVIGQPLRACLTQSRRTKKLLLGQKEFFIVSGDRVLDFVDIRVVARTLVDLSVFAPNAGVINIGSG